VYLADQRTLRQWAQSNHSNWNSNKKMPSSRKKSERPSPAASAGEQNRNVRGHASGLTMSRLLFARVDRVVKQLRLPSRGEFMITATTEILKMCEDRKQRFLPELVVRYDDLRKPKTEELNIDNPLGAQRCGTHFSIETEERIAIAVKRIGWSRNQFISEAMKTIVDMCEDPNKRLLPIVVILHDAALAYSAAPIKLKRKGLHVVG
jgi:hypothetical protein